MESHTHYISLNELFKKGFKSAYQDTVAGDLLKLELVDSPDPYHWGRVAGHKKAMEDLEEGLFIIDIKN